MKNGLLTALPVGRAILSRRGRFDCRRPGALRRLRTYGCLVLAVSALNACRTEDDVSVATTSECVSCHREVTPNIVKDWELSQHRVRGVDCAMCHGSGHRSAEDVALVKTATPEVCGTCHPVQTDQFKAGKHALAWASMEAMPTTHWLPMALTGGMKGCGGCHQVGIKTEEEIRQLKDEGIRFGLASCDACHTRHLFSVKEAREQIGRAHV